MSHLGKTLLDVSEVEKAAKSLTETEGKVRTVLALLVEPVVGRGLVGGEEAGDEDRTGCGHRVAVSPLHSVESLHPLHHSRQRPVQALGGRETCRGLIRVRAGVWWLVVEDTEVRGPVVLAELHLTHYHTLPGSADN